MPPPTNGAASEKRTSGGASPRARCSRTTMITAALPALFVSRATKAAESSDGDDRMRVGLRDRERTRERRVEILHHELVVDARRIERLHRRGGHDRPLEAGHLEVQRRALRHVAREVRRGLRPENEVRDGGHARADEEQDAEEQHGDHRPRATLFRRHLLRLHLHRRHLHRLLPLLLLRRRGISVAALHDGGRYHVAAARPPCQAPPQRGHAAHEAKRRGRHDVNRRV